jgi:hypothetical protein
MRLIVVMLSVVVCLILGCGTPAQQELRAIAAEEEAITASNTMTGVEKLVAREKTAARRNVVFDRMRNTSATF